jgi:hypothetical protein
MLGRQLFELGPRNKQYVCHEKPMAVLATETRNETNVYYLSKLDRNTKLMFWH